MARVQRVDCRSPDGGAAAGSLTTQGKQEMMRVLVVAAVALVLCASCATLSPERRYLGAWAASHEGATLTVLFETGNRCVLSEGDNAIEATEWKVEDGEITLTVDNQVVRGFISSEGELILSADGVSIPFKRVR
jgi:hypothetical protein